MTRDEVTNIVNTYTPSDKPPKRLGYDERSAYNKCIEELKMVVVSCPTIVNYIAYLNIRKAYKMNSSLSTLANSVLKGITKEARGSTPQEAVTASIQTLKTNIQKQEAYTAAAHRIYTESHTWINSFVYSIEKQAEGVTLSSDVRESLTLLAKTTPAQLSGNKVTLPSDMSIECTGTTATLFYNTTAINPAPFITQGNLILRSGVTHTDFTTIGLNASTSGSTSEVRYPVRQLNTPLLVDMSSRESVAKDIASTYFTLDTTNEEVATCLRVFGLSRLEQPVAELAHLTYSPVVKFWYRRLNSVCQKWRQPGIMNQLHKHGFNYVLNRHKSMSAYSSLKSVNASVAAFTDTRGLLR